jgi:hypothetical protein
MSDLLKTLKIFLIVFILTLIIVSGYTIFKVSENLEERKFQEKQYTEYINKGYSVYVDGALAEPKYIDLNDYSIEFSPEDKAILLKKNESSKNNIIFYILK